MTNIAIIGFGYVGKAVGRFFSATYHIKVYDPYLQGNEELFSSGNVVHEAQKEVINTCDLAIICAPTPMGSDGSVDVSIIEQTVAWLDTPLILIKSTIPPGTTKRLRESTHKRLVFSPEYIGEGNYPVPYWKGYPHPTDMKYHDFTILGGDKKDTSAVLQFFKKVAGAEMKYIQTDSTTAELCKYMENAFLGTKVIFVNEFYDIAKAFGVDFDELRELWLLDGRVGRSHSTVYPESRGFGGKCLPKDINGILKASEAVGYEPRLLQSVLEVNKIIRGA